MLVSRGRGGKDNVCTTLKRFKFVCFLFSLFEYWEKVFIFVNSGSFKVFIPILSVRGKLISECSLLNGRFFSLGMVSSVVLLSLMYFFVSVRVLFLLLICHLFCYL